MGKALEGIRVIDMTHDQAGPSCTQMLAWLGAEVIKIEMADGMGDRARWLRRDDPDLDSYFFLLLNNNKKSTTLNLRDPRGKELFKTLIKSADIMAENRGPGAMDRLGLGYEDLKKINPKLIYAAVKGFGSYGPYSDYKCFEPVAQATSGALSCTGFDDRPPAMLGANVGDSGTGMHTVIGILAALWQRQTTGKGQVVEVSMQDAVVNFSRIWMNSFNETKVSPPRRGNGWGGRAGVGTFKSAPGGPDDYIYLTAMARRGRMWTAMLTTIGREDLLEDPIYADPSDHPEASAEINAMIEEWTMKHTKQEGMRILGEAGVPCSATFNAEDIYYDEHLREREMIVTIDHPERGEFMVPGCPVKLSDSPVTVTPAPLLGAHTAEVLSEFAGIDDARLAELRDASVV